MTPTEFNKMRIKCPVCGGMVVIRHNKIDYHDGTTPLDFGYFTGCVAAYDNDGVHKQSATFFTFTVDEGLKLWNKFVEGANT